MGSDLKKAVVEFIATALFVFIGAGSVAAAAGTAAAPLGTAMIAISLAHGIAIFVLASATGRITNAHLNPAVTIAFMASGVQSVRSGIMYIIAQLLGAALGALVLKFCLVNGDVLGQHSVNLEAVSLAGAFVVEMVLTAVLVIVIFSVAVDEDGFDKIAPLVIGLTVAVIHFVAVPLTGASVNPARTFGPALATGSWDHIWLYFAAPVLGALIGLAIYKLFLKSAD